MKRFIYILFLITTYLYSHELMMNVIDNKDKTIKEINDITIILPMMLPSNFFFILLNIDS